MIFDVRIQGLSPLLCNACPIEVGEAERPTQNGEKLKPRETAAKALYLHEDRPYYPGSNLLRSLIDAGTYFKVGKSKISTLRSSIVPAAVAITPEVLYLEPGEWEVDSRPVTIPATGGRITRHRPRFDKWELEFTIHLDDEIMSHSLLRQLVDCAGRRVGIGDFRPARRGPFGRFVVTSWVQRDE